MLKTLKPENNIMLIMFKYCETEINHRVQLYNYKCKYNHISLIDKQIRAIYRELVLFPRSIKTLSYILENESKQTILGCKMSMFTNIAMTIIVHVHS